MFAVIKENKNKQCLYWSCNVEVSDITVGKG